MFFRLHTLDFIYDRLSVSWCLYFHLPTKKSFHIDLDIQPAKIFIGFQLFVFTFWFRAEFIMKCRLSYENRRVLRCSNDSCGNTTNAIEKHCRCGARLANGIVFLDAQTINHILGVAKSSNTRALEIIVEQHPDAEWAVFSTHFLSNIEKTIDSRDAYFTDNNLLHPLDKRW